MIVNNITQGSLGSHKGPGVSTWKAYCMWIMTIAQDLDRAATLLEPPTVTVGIEDLAVECERVRNEILKSAGCRLGMGSGCHLYRS